MINNLIMGDCLEVMKTIPDKSIDMILCDLPYGTTACKWDTIIPFEPLWEQYERIIKDNGAIVLTASQPFTTNLIYSNINLYKTIWYWKKNRPTGFQNAKKQQLRIIEEVIIFYKKPPTYNPQGIVRINKTCKNSKSCGGDTVREDVVESSGKGSLRTAGKQYIQEFTNYPINLLEFNSSEKTKIHPTQKPVALFEYLIKTYTNKNETVLDNCMGSGTTGVACVNTNRNFIGIELNEKYFNIAKERIDSIREEELRE